VPTFNDRYWQPGGTPDLRPERSWGGDLGLRLDRPRGHVEVTAFGHWRRDQIVWQPTGNGYWSPVNVGRVRALGGEASGEWAWSLPYDATLESGLTYTLTDARNRTDPGSPSYDEPLRYVPRDQMKVHSTLAWGPAALTMHARYTGRRAATSDGSQFLDAYVVGSTRLRLKHEVAGVRTALSVQIDNLFDTDYQSVGGRPMPPRHARVRLFVSL
jgi:iron complex outermembrane receptor protein